MSELYRASIKHGQAEMLVYGGTAEEAINLLRHYFVQPTEGDRHLRVLGVNYGEVESITDGPDGLIQISMKDGRVFRNVPTTGER